MNRHPLKPEDGELTITFVACLNARNQIVSPDMLLIYFASNTKYFVMLINGYFEIQNEEPHFELDIVFDFR